MNANKPAFPVAVTPKNVQFGISIRAYLAAKAMQGLLSNTNIDLAPCEIAQDAVLYADALIAELNKGENP